MKIKHKASLSIAAIFLSAGSAGAQSLATGDSRSVGEPTYPGVCQTLYANFSSSQRSSPPTTDDTSRLQDGLNQCAGTGQSVVLAPSGSNDAFYTGSLTINGAGLSISAGATLIGNSYASNANLLQFSGTNASLMGPETVDGRGDLISGTPRLVQASKISNFIVYNVTLAQAAHANLYVEGGNGFTGSGVSTPGGSPSLSNIVVNGAYATQSLSGAYTKIDGRNSSYLVNAWLANVSLDATAQNGDQYANVGLYNSNVTPSGTGVTTSSFTTTGSVPNCAF
ncbi:hypothetical protein [Paraburkholderia sp. JPY419]|uniref:hypothetical protein n=1 Tax=Paraburkholderia sp. JPY419 TaxID=667660 RepID=UPI003D22FD59